MPGLRSENRQIVVNGGLPARLREQEVAGSNPVAPTIQLASSAVLRPAWISVVPGRALYAPTLGTAGSDHGRLPTKSELAASVIRIGRSGTPMLTLHLRPIAVHDP